MLRRVAAVPVSSVMPKSTCLLSSKARVGGDGIRPMQAPQQVSRGLRSLSIGRQPEPEAASATARVIIMSIAVIRSAFGVLLVEPIVESHLRDESDDARTPARRTAEFHLIQHHLGLLQERLLVALLCLLLGRRVVGRIEMEGLPRSPPRSSRGRLRWSWSAAAAFRPVSADLAAPQLGHLGPGFGPLTRSADRAMADADLLGDRPVRHGGIGGDGARQARSPGASL